MFIRRRTKHCAMSVVLNVAGVLAAADADPPFPLVLHARRWLHHGSWVWVGSGGV